MELVKIYQGESKTINLKIRDKVTGDPVDLTDKVITGRLQGCPGKIDLIADVFESVSDELGHLKMNLTDVHTLAMKKGVVSFEVVLSVVTPGVGEDPDTQEDQIVRFENLVEVKARL